MIGPGRCSRSVSLWDVFCTVQNKTGNSVHEHLSLDEVTAATKSVLRVVSQTDTSPYQAKQLAQRSMEEAGAGPQGMSFAQFERAVLAPVECDREAARVPRVLLVAVLPALYGVSTRIGFVTLPMHAVASGLSLFEVGLVLGLFQLMRALANLIIVRRGSVATLPLALLSLCGFVFNILFARHWLSCWMYTFTGLGEIIVSLQHEMLLLPCMAANPASLKQQFSWVCLGACIAFVGGGSLYARFGFDTACVLGGTASALQLILGGVLYWLSQRRVSFSPWIHFPPDAFTLRPFAMSVASLMAMSHIAAQDDDVLPATRSAMVERVDAVIDATLGRVPQDKMVMECCTATIMGIDEACATWMPDAGDLELESGCFERLGRISDSAPPLPVEGSQVPWMVRPFILSQVFIALCIGMFLGTGGLYYAETYGTNVAVFGVSMGFGELLGMATSYLLPKKTDSLQASHRRLQPLRRTILVLSVMAAIAGVIVLFTIMPHLLGAVVFQLVFQILNDVWTYLVNDVIYQLAPISQYRRLQGQGQMYRRLGNALAGFIGPILLGVWAPLPFVVAASTLAAWTLLLTVVFACHFDTTNSRQPGQQDRVLSVERLTCAIQHVCSILNDGRRQVRTTASTSGLKHSKSRESLSLIEDHSRESLAFMIREVYADGLLGLPLRLFGHAHG